MQRAINGFLPDGTIFGSTAYFSRSTKPVTRVDGSALVVGDLWHTPNTGVRGFWNGTYWLSPQIRDFEHRYRGAAGGFSSDLNVTASTTVGSHGRLFFAIPCGFGGSIFLSKFYFVTDNVPTGSWTVGIAPVTVAAGVGSFLGATVTPVAAATNYEGNISTLITKDAGNFILMLRANLATTGALRLTDYGIYYHLVL